MIGAHARSIRISVITFRIALLELKQRKLNFPLRHICDYRGAARICQKAPQFTRKGGFALRRGLTFPGHACENLRLSLQQYASRDKYSIELSFRGAACPFVDHVASLRFLGWT
jgi:hypothetical protein